VALRAGRGDTAAHMADLIAMAGVVKRYGPRTALGGLDVTVRAGEIAGLLGPNGAGKSTTLSILATLLAPDAGTVVVAGLLHQPRVVLLDEPTVGVDPQSRERIFDAVRALAAGGAAVLYSTHYMEEAERLCGRVVLMDGGRAVASGTPAELVAASGLAPRLELRLGGTLPRVWLDGVPGARETDRRDGHVGVRITDTTQVAEILRRAAGADVRDVVLHRPDLADVFFSRTGRALRDESAAA